MKTTLLLETLLIYLLVPTLMLFGVIPKASVMPLLWVGALYAYFMMKKERKDLDIWTFSSLQLKRVLSDFLIFGALLFLYVWLFYRPMLFSLIEQKPFMWLFIVIAYPLFSVLAQEYLFRHFFFYRFKKVIKKPWIMLLLNATLFAYVHALYGNVSAIVLTFVGAILFMRTYMQTRSIWMVSIEHALYGNLIFTLGIGDFFYHASRPL